MSDATVILVAQNCHSLVSSCMNVFFVCGSDGENADFQFTVHAMPHPLVRRAESKEEMDAWVCTLNALADVGRWALSDYI